MSQDSLVFLPVSPLPAYSTLAVQKDHAQMVMRSGRTCLGMTCLLAGCFAPAGHEIQNGPGAASRPSGYSRFAGALVLVRESSPGEFDTDCGSGFPISPTEVVTARHVVEPAVGNGRLKKAGFYYRGRTYRIESASMASKPEPLQDGTQDDWCVLRVTPPVADYSTVQPRGPLWFLLPRRVAAHGSVVRITREGKPGEPSEAVLDNVVREGYSISFVRACPSRIATNVDTINGMSGGPVVWDGKIVAMVCANVLMPGVNTRQHLTECAVSLDHILRRYRQGPPHVDTIVIHARPD